jgi:hypothetical protein
VIDVGRICEFRAYWLGGTHQKGNRGTPELHASPRDDAHPGRPRRLKGRGLRRELEARLSALSSGHHGQYESELLREGGLPQKWGAGGDRRWRICIVDGPESLSESGSERAVVDRAANLEQEIGTSSRPSHLLRPTRPEDTHDGGAGQPTRHPAVLSRGNTSCSVRSRNGAPSRHASMIEVTPGGLAYRLGHRRRVME